MGESPPIFWTSGNGRFSMSRSLKVGFSFGLRRAVVRLEGAVRPAVRFFRLRRGAGRKWRRICAQLETWAVERWGYAARRSKIIVVSESWESVERRSFARPAAVGTSRWRSARKRSGHGRRKTIRKAARGRRSTAQHVARGSNARSAPARHIWASVTD